MSGWYSPTILENTLGLILYQSFPKREILESSKLFEFADDNFKFDENARKFSKWVKNSVGKGEIACYKQLLLLSQCFQETYSADM